MGTTVSGSQIARSWLAAGGIGLAIAATSGVTALFVGRNVAGIATFQDFSDGSRVMSGNLLIQSGSNTLFADAAKRMIGIRTRTPKTELDVVGTVSGNSLFVSRALSGAGLTDCDAGTNKLLWDASTGRFSCGTISATAYTAGQGLALSASNAFSLNSTITGSLLEYATVSGTTVYGEKSLRSSGSLVWEGSASGSILYLGGQFSGAGLTDCDLTTQTLAWDASTNRFSCGTDSDTTYTAGQGLTLSSTVFSTNGTLTGTMLRFLTVSGSLIYAKNTVASSGGIVLEGTLSGSALRGFGLNTDCDTAGTSKLLWDATAGRLSCGTDTDTDTNTTYTAGQGLTLNSTSFRTNSVLSGVTLWGLNSLRSSGALVWDGAGSGQALNLAGGNITIFQSGALVWNELSKPLDLRFEGDTNDALFFLDGSADRIGIGTRTPKTTVEVMGTVSGSTVIGTTISGSTLKAGRITPRYLSTEIFASGSTITTGSGKVMLTIPDTMSGYKLSSAWVSVGTGGYTNSTTVQIRDAEKGFRKLFSTALTIDDRRYGSGQVVIDTAKNDVGAFDRLFVDIPNVTTTAPKSPMVLVLKFFLP